MKTIKIILALTIWSQVAYNQIDNKATAETKALYKYLKKTAKKHIIFGHQHATEYGHGWENEPNRSDVLDVTGSHPGVVGVDFSGFTGNSEKTNDAYKNRLRNTVAATYNRGGITTVAWHFPNPASKGGFYWRDSLSVAAIPLIKPGGSHHQKYKEILTGIAAWAKTVKGNDGKLVPMIFRPYHEFDGDWFWWGKSHCTRDDFISVWQYTVKYLRDSMQVHNFIYAFSPDNKFKTEKEYLERYPGDDFVDMLGMDNYGDFGRAGKYNIAAGIAKLKIVDKYSRKAHKLAAFTETGLESIPDKGWWTDSLLSNLKLAKLRLCYVLVWRNDKNSKTHFYAPYPGHSSVPDFINFYKDPYTFFENDLKNVYK